MQIREHSENDLAHSSGGSGSAKGKKCFLRKGDGVARYGLKSNSGPKRKPQNSQAKASSETPTSRSQGQKADDSKVSLLNAEWKLTYVYGLAIDCLNCINMERSN